ncbi:MAG: ACT domain-containing protein [Thermoanaerobaculia bacterium]
MSGERGLDRLLAGIRPRRNPGTYLFCSVPPEQRPGDVRAIATFEESEGRTLVVEEGEAARHGLAGEFRCVWITLEVHSDLAAVGFLARVAGALAAEGIPCNAIAAFHHDHLFVPDERADDALAVLERLAAAADRRGA